MDFPIQIKAIRMGLSIISLKGSQAFPNYHVFLSLRTVFHLTNSADTDKMPHYGTFYLGLHCLSKYMFRSFQYTKG